MLKLEKRWLKDEKTIKRMKYRYINENLGKKETKVK